MVQPDHSADDRRSSFGSLIAAGDYDRVRADYPPGAVAFVLERVLPARGPRVLDLGAGTGKLTRALVGAGAEVVAVDPSATMLERLAAQQPDVETAVGTGEDIPLPDASVDAVTVAQAWHWMQPERAGAEIARVLRPGGSLVLLWNVKDTGVPWVAEYEAVVEPPSRHRFDTSGDLDPMLLVPPPFVADGVLRVDNPHVLPPGGLPHLAASVSTVATSPDRDGLLAQVVELAGRVAAADGRVTIPQTCRCFRFLRP